MKVTYVVDGYNLAHAMGYLAGSVKRLGLERGRRALEDFLVAAFGDQASEVTIVYDAAHRPSRIPKEQTYKGITILLPSPRETADDLIESIIAGHPSPKHLAVVSNDHRLQTAARHRGAQAMTCAEFLDSLERRGAAKAPGGQPEPEKKCELSKKEVTDWLEEFAGLEDEPGLRDALEPFDFEKE
jgi:predicted RNA-binding protein with PIN domain